MPDTPTTPKASQEPCSHSQGSFNQNLPAGEGKTKVLLICKGCGATLSEQVVDS